MAIMRIVIEIFSVMENQSKYLNLVLLGYN